MKEQFVTNEIALKLRELGFDEKCLAMFLIKDVLGLGIKGDLKILDYTTVKNSTFAVDTLITAPLWQQAIDWFRDKYNIHIAIISYTNSVKIGDKILYEILIGNKENNFDPSIDNSTKRLKFGYENNEFSYYNLYDSYKEAREQAILKTLELCQNKK